MASLNSVQVKQALAKTVCGTVVNDTPVAIRMKYIGTGSVTSVATTTATQFVLTTSDGGAETFTFADYTTMGALAEAINNSAYWDARVLDALRADVTSGSPFVDNASLTVTSDGYYDALVDTSVTKNMTYRCAYNRGVNWSEQKPTGAHRVHLQSVVYKADIFSATANEFRIYEYNPTTLAETQVYQAASVDNTETTVNFANGEGKITSGWNNDLIVRILDDTSLADGGYMYSTYIAE